MESVHPDCPNAPNPFHQCTSRCFQLISSGDASAVPKKEKRLFGFGKKTPVKNTPPASPSRALAGNRSPRPSYYAKNKVESHGSPSYSSSEDSDNFFSRRTPPRGHPSQAKDAALDNDPLSMSPSLSVYTGRDPITSRFNRPRGEPQSHPNTDADMSPRSSITRSRTPEHRPRTPDSRPRTPEHRTMTPDNRPRTAEHRPRTPDSRPRTPEHRPRTPDNRPRTPEHWPRTPDTRPRTPGHRPRTPDTRPRTPVTRARTPERQPESWTPETRPRTPNHQHGSPEDWPRETNTRSRTAEYRARSPGPRSRTPEPQARYHEPRARTPEPRARTPEPGPRIFQTQPTFLGTKAPVKNTPPSSPSRALAGQRSPRVYNSIGTKADSVYTEDDEESVLLYPELLLSPQERPTSRPITPKRRGNETPTEQDEFDQMAESESSDDNFSFVDDDQSVLYPEIVSSSDAKPKSGSSTPVHHKFRTSSGEQEENLKQNEPPELPDESQSFTLSEIARMRGMKYLETQSMISESYISVGNYKVRASLSDTLQHILDKHGDIASGSKLQSTATRSYYLETLAAVVLELQSTPLRELKEKRVGEMVAMVKDIESVKIQVGWIRSLLEEIHEAAKHFDGHEATVVEKEGCERDLLKAKEEMEERMKELVKKEKETKECRERVTEIGGRVGSLEMKRLRLDKSLAFLTSKVNKFQGKSVLEHIF